MQVSIIAPGEAATAESEKFYQILGIANPEAFTPAAPPPAAPPAETRMWALEYTCEGVEGTFGWPLLDKGASPRVDAGALLDKVCMVSHSLGCRGLIAATGRARRRSAHLSSPACRQAALQRGVRLWLCVPVHPR
jgi:hypothetical protein